MFQSVGFSIDPLRRTAEMRGRSGPNWSLVAETLDELFIWSTSPSIWFLFRSLSPPGRVCSQHLSQISVLYFMMCASALCQDIWSRSVLYGHVSAVMFVVLLFLCRFPSGCSAVSEYKHFPEDLHLRLSA